MVQGYGRRGRELVPSGCCLCAGLPIVMGTVPLAWEAGRPFAVWVTFLWSSVESWSCITASFRFCSYSRLLVLLSEARL